MFKTSILYNSYFIFLPYKPKVKILISYFILKSEIGQIMTILPFGGPSSIVKTRLPSYFARSGHIYIVIHNTETLINVIHTKMRIYISAYSHNILFMYP